MSKEKEELEKLLNVPVTITLSGKEFKVSTPTIKDLSEAQQTAKELKKKRRKEALQERLELLTMIPKDMDTHEKNEILNSYLPKEMSVQDKMEIYNSFPAELSENDKNIRMSTILAERNEADWTETLYILWKGIKKNHPEVSLSDIEGLVTIKDLKEVIKVLNPSEEEEKVVEGVAKK